MCTEPITVAHRASMAPYYGDSEWHIMEEFSPKSNAIFRSDSVNVTENNL